jgi:regulator of protease activity HflC (stomatin/prohibitin superfamily)
MNFKPGKNKRITPDGEPLEDAGGGGGFPGRGRGGFFRRGSRGPGIGMGSNSLIKIVIPTVIGLIVVAFLIINSVKIVDAGNRGVLLNFGAVDVSRSLNEGIHFVVPVRDNVVQMEVRTQRITEDAASASGDLQDVRTQVALNYHLDPDNSQNVYKNLGLDYANRVIVPAIQESVKQVTARFNAEELITQRESVKTEIEQQIRARLAAYNIVVDAISITEFQFSADFVRAVEAKVAAQQRALQAQNELQRIEIEAQQAEARAVGEQQANIARAEGVRQANVLQAQGEAQAITTIDEQLSQSPSYLEWLKSQKWDGQLPLVVGGSGTGTDGQSVTPFIEIPTSRNEIDLASGEGGNGANTGNATSSSSVPSGGSAGLQSVLNNTVLNNVTG